MKKKRNVKKKLANKKKKSNTLNNICLVLIILIFIGIISISGFFCYIYMNAPEFKSELLYKRESSNIYDSKGDLIASIGTEKRQIVAYEELPQVLIDAIVATEDSRFFEHDGFDIYRFMKAGVGFLKGEDAGGASTLTMQLSKNTYTSTNAEGFDGIVRKFTDIYMSIFKIEKDYSKKEIIEFYVNAPYLGAGSYGVQMAAKTYFNKDVSNINLVEASIIAGLFQAPGEYDPYVNPDKTNEVIDKTGKNPYEVSMDIYTTMVKSKQDVINNFYNNHKFKDDKVQVGIGVIDNDTGAIIAVGAGRNKNSELSLNYATQIKRHPGSTAKPLFDYGPGIEFKNWSTYTPFIDKPVRYTNGGVMNNVDYKYKGFMTLEQCLVKSRNTCALQAFQKLSNSKIDKFVTSLGIIPEYLGNSNYINEAHSIGGFTGVSPVQLAAAYAAFGNGGYYTLPHSVNKIIYKNGSDDDVLIFDYPKNKVMKDTTAYMISYMLQKVTTYRIKVKGTEVATKTGTSSYDSARLKVLGLSSKVIQDSWTTTFSPDYSVAIWYGYDELTKKTYNTSSHAWSERNKIQAKIVNNIMEENSKFERPSGIVASKVVVGTNPPKLPSASTPSSKIQTHLFIKGTQPTKVVQSVQKSQEKTTESNKTTLPSVLEP